MWHIWQSNIRVSRAPDGKWYAIDLSVVGAPIIGPYDTYAEARAATRQEQAAE